MPLPVERQIVPTSLGVLVFVVIGLLFAVSSFGFSLHNFIAINQEPARKHYYQPGRILPSRYNVDETLLSPVRLQGDRGTCWIFQIIGVMEAQYKLQAMEKGYMRESEYLRLSHEALGKVMVQKCQKYPKAEPCINSLRSLNTSTAGSFQEFQNFVEYWPDLMTSIVPESCCPYNEESELQCPSHFEKCLEKNPLEFKFLNVYYTTNIRDAKQRLYETGFPQAMSLEMPMQRYWFNCANNLVKDSRACKEKTFKCKSNSAEFCAPHDFKLFKKSDTEFIFENTGTLVPGTPHAMLLTGFNDEFVVKRPVNNSRIHNTIGGFVVKNSWGDRGHTIEYLMGNITEDQEAVICPNKDDVFRWIPATAECINRTKDPTKCSTNLKLQRGGSIANHADELTCVNETHCAKGEKYVLLGQSEDAILPVMKWSPEGVPLAMVYRVSTGEATIIDTLPIQHLYYAFQIEDHPMNEAGRCGYVMFSYDSITNQLEVGAGPAGGFFEVEGLLIEWKEKSFTGAKSRGYNYEYVKQSTEVFHLKKAANISDYDL